MRQDPGVGGREKQEVEVKIEPEKQHEDDVRKLIKMGFIYKQV